MISEQDIVTLTEAFTLVFATKEEHLSLERKVDGVIEIVGDLKVEVGEINDKMDLILIRMDNFIGSVRGLEQENGAGAAHLERHDRQLDVLASVTGITLPN